MYELIYPCAYDVKKDNQTRKDPHSAMHIGGSLRMNINLSSLNPLSIGSDRNIKKIMNKVCNYGFKKYKKVNKYD